MNLWNQNSNSESPFPKMLNTDLNTENLTEEFAKNKSLVIDNYLSPHYVEILYNWFSHTMPEHWWFASYRATASGKGNHLPRAASKRPSCGLLSPTLWPTPTAQHL